MKLALAMEKEETANRESFMLIDAIVYNLLCDQAATLAVHQKKEKDPSLARRWIGDSSSKSTHLTRNLDYLQKLLYLMESADTCTNIEAKNVRILRTGIASRDGYFCSV